MIILGGGPATSELHLPALVRLGWLKTVEVYDRLGSNVERLKFRWPELRVGCADFRDALKARPEVDAIIVALPNSLHETAVERSLSLRLPVLCEKPLALSAESCRRLHMAAEQSGLPLIVGMSRRFSASIAAARQVIETGMIGDILRVEVAHGGPYDWPSNSGEAFRPENGGVLADMGVHYLDLVSLLLGPVSIERYADDWAGGVEAEATLELRSERDVPARVALSRRRKLANQMRVLGNEGRVEIDCDDFEKCRVFTRRGALVGEFRSTSPFSLAGLPTDFISAFVEQYSRFARTLRGEPCGLSTALEHAALLEIIENCYRRRPSPYPACGHPLPRSELGRGKGEGALVGSGVQGANPSGNPLPIRGSGHVPRERRSLPGAVAITGATGFIGTRLVERLFEREKTEVKCLIHSFHRVPGIARYPVQLQSGPITDVDRMRSALRGSRFLFHLAYGLSGSDKERRRITVEGTRAAVEAAIANGLEAVVVLSTLWVFGFPDHPKELDESAPRRPYGGEYARSKAAMERWCLERAKRSGGTRIVVLNPGVVYGPGGRTYTLRPRELAQAGSFCWIENGRGLCHYAYVDNVVDAMWAAALTPEAHGHRFIIADGRCSWREFLEPILGVPAHQVPSYSESQLQALQPRYGLRDLLGACLANAEVRRLLTAVQPFKSLSRWARQMRSGGGGTVRSLIRSAADMRASEAGIPPLWLAQLFPPSTTRFSARRAGQILQWRPAVDLAEGQRRSVRWLEQHLELAAERASGRS